MLHEDYGGSLSTDDIEENPHKYGWVTFDEFKRNRDKFIGRKDDIFASADKGSHILKSIRRHIYEVEGYRCRSIEDVERVASNMGIDPSKLSMCPDMIQAGAGKFDVIVRFLTEETKKKRSEWQ